MARLLSPIASILRGSIAGLTFTANQFHQIVVRARTAPVQPNTTPQTDIRTAFTEAENVWETLSEETQRLWGNYAGFTPYTGPLGNYLITGRLMFHAVFGLLFYLNNTLAAGLSAITDPPPFPGFSQMPSFTAINPGVPNTGVSLQATISIGGDDLTIFAQRSIVFSPTRKRFKGPWDSATNQVVDFAAGVPTTIDFFNLEDGDIIFIHLRGIRTDDPHRIAQDIIIRGVAQIGAI